MAGQSSARSAIECWARESSAGLCKPEDNGGFLFNRMGGGNLATCTYIATQCRGSGGMRMGHGLGGRRPATQTAEWFLAGDRSVNAGYSVVANPMTRNGSCCDGVLQVGFRRLGLSLGGCLCPKNRQEDQTSSTISCLIDGVGYGMWP